MGFPLLAVAATRTGKNKLIHSSGNPFGTDVRGAIVAVCGRPGKCRSSKSINYIVGRFSCQNISIRGIWYQRDGNERRRTENINELKEVNTYLFACCPIYPQMYYGAGGRKRAGIIHTLWHCISWWGGCIAVTLLLLLLVSIPFDWMVNIG